MEPLLMTNKIIPFPMEEDIASRTDLNQWVIEGVFYVYLIDGAFGHLVIDLQLLAPAFLAAAAVLAILKSPGALKWLALPSIMFFTMFVIDYFGYPESMSTLKLYIVWLLAFIVCLVLHEDPGFFLRGKIFLLFYMLAHFFFLAPFEEDPSRYGLRDTPHMIMGNPSDLAYWCIFAVLAPIAEVSRQKGFVRIGYVAIALISFMVLLLTVSRGALVILIICILIFLILNIRQLGGFGSAFSLLAVLGMAGIFIFFFQSAAIDLYLQRMENESGSFSGRSYLLDEAIKVFLDSPWLGTGKDEVNAPLHSRVSVPHNQILGMAVHYGIWPPVFLILFWVQLTAKSVSLLMVKQEQPSFNLSSELFVFLLFLFLMSMVSNVMLLSTFCVFYMAKILVYKPNFYSL
jgi:O-antigen ligase